MEKLTPSDFDIENLFGRIPNAKPLTKGLGFNQKLTMKEKSELLRVDLMQNNDQKTDFVKDQISMGDLSPFYSGELNTAEEVTYQTIEKLSHGVNLTKANWNTRIGAYFIDLSVISLLFIAIIGVGYLLSGLTLNEIISNKNEVIFLTLPISIMIYLFYFSFLDKTSNSTVGKNIFHIRTVGLKGEQDPSFLNTFFRAFISLLSVLTFGLTILLDFHGKISETKVVND
jgi:uncharacterized RDD family membrane protein YckC